MILQSLRNSCKVVKHSQKNSVRFLTFFTNGLGFPYRQSDILLSASAGNALSDLILAESKSHANFGPPDLDSDKGLNSVNDCMSFKIHIRLGTLRSRSIQSADCTSWK
jgi:hypothetical protein